MSDFDHFSPEALVFLSDLKANNTRDWFAANKKTYEAEIKTPAHEFGEAMCEALSDLTDISHSTKVFRIHRDIRFSKDKTPYNAHLHMSFIPEAGVENPPMWFFGLSPERLSLGCGVFQYDKTELVAFRGAMAGERGAELIRLTQELRSASVRIDEPELKRVPPGFDKDHPHSEALCRKGFSGWLDIDDPAFVTQVSLVDKTVSQMRRLLPIFRFLSPIE